MQKGYMHVNAEGGYIDYCNGYQSFRPDRTKVNRINYNIGMKKFQKTEEDVKDKEVKKPAEPKKP